MATRNGNGGSGFAPAFIPSDYTLAQSSNVVQLPTAARRKVHQRWNATTREARKTLPKFTGEHITQSRRNALKDAKVIREMNSGTTALCLALAIFDTMSKAAKKRTRGQIIKRGSNHEFGALAILLEERTFGQNWDLQWALERLMGGN